MCGGDCLCTLSVKLFGYKHVALGILIVRVKYELFTGITALLSVANPNPLLCPPCLPATVER